MSQKIAEYEVTELPATTALVDKQTDGEDSSSHELMPGDCQVPALGIFERKEALRLLAQWLEKCNRGTSSRSSA